MGVGAASTLTQMSIVGEKCSGSYHSPTQSKYFSCFSSGSVTKTFEARSNCRGVIIIIIPVIIFNCFTKEAIKQLSYSNIFMKNPEKEPVWANRSYYLRLKVNLIAQLFWSLLQWCAVLLHLLVKYTFYDYCCLHGPLCSSLKQALKKREKAWSWRVSWFYLETCWENIFTMLWKVFQNCCFFFGFYEGVFFGFYEGDTKEDYVISHLSWKSHEKNAYLARI